MRPQPSIMLEDAEILRKYVIWLRQKWKKTSKKMRGFAFGSLSLYYYENVYSILLYFLLLFGVVSIDECRQCHNRTL